MTTNYGVKFGLLVKEMMQRGDMVSTRSWQSQDVSQNESMSVSRELRHVTRRWVIPESIELLQAAVKPNLPWAEDHFLERVSGEPLNPPPSEAWWPHRVRGNEDHKEGDQFSHTYPERFWPKWANRPESEGTPHKGVRYFYGDLNNVVSLLLMDLTTRQAYLPVWFPEDTGAAYGQRVPCSLGYQFLFRQTDCGKWMGEVSYGIRSCDLLRHFTDDVYMAGRLLQWVCQQLQDHGIDAHPLLLVMNIGSLHTFAGDEPLMTKMFREILGKEEDDAYGAAI